MSMNPVQRKVSCTYVIGVTDETSTKRNNQTYKVTATNELNPQALIDRVETALSTEKLDGTCCLIQEFQGVPWLWARHDRKPCKAGERRFAQFQKLKQIAKKNGEHINSVFNWNMNKDFKDPPVDWIPASQLEVKDGVIMPDSIGHTPGWIPVQHNSRQHCWHLSAIDLNKGLALVLREDKENPEYLVIESQPLSALCGLTCELIGTNINGNPYSLGSKKFPVHLLVPHGSFLLSCPSPADYSTMVDWFNSEGADAQVEGIVWHCSNGALYKLHRHHLNLPWPLAETRLGRKKVKVHVEEGDLNQEKNLFTQLSKLNGQVLSSLLDLHKMFDPAALS
ncbi:RNA ligase 1-like [Physella acuta]|uniref:RNA ligase 1-like n=1 Tax=Physella acuta TaxID=109671 RepID=UPI0027DE02BD|nr:RNA ligase 1-like [Physella acuta]XP_059160638.1 RNA ligase 1-like [Physella acuta]